MINKGFPKQGDIIFIDSEPHARHEYGGHDPQSGNIQRPMIVLSSDAYNVQSGMVSGMVITSTDYPNQPAHLYEKIIDVSSGVKGTIVKWYLPSYDYTARNGRIIGQINKSHLGSLLKDVRNIYSI
ncbi:type II toxin-antitoxin system PemK/MazF family toxin [Companilactobacillus mishanensis]|uniref:type II toxin-antitoxin system PemK/MazF family toxin n=1 Tax=Companilactobacillus mishanensis TaxID=2486008 RepID=UPI0012968542|nr:type II toxin-antitoxin system PemK/MazF family toxin [Companilactobacillus mishanensis]